MRIFLLLLVISCTVLVAASRRRLDYRCKGSKEQLEYGNILYMRKGQANERRWYKCDAGYVMNIQENDPWFQCVERDDVFFWRNTKNTALNLTDVKCERRAECSAPPSIENMDYTFLQRYRIKHSNRQPIQGYFTGDTYEYQCKTGFNQVSSKSNAHNDVTQEGPVTCSSDGTWNHTVTDTCVACDVISDWESQIRQPDRPAPCEKQMSNGDQFRMYVERESELAMEMKQKLSIQDLQRMYFERELAIQKKQLELINNKNEMIEEQMQFYKNMNLLQSMVNK